MVLSLYLPLIRRHGPSRTSSPTPAAVRNTLSAAITVSCLSSRTSGLCNPSLVTSFLGSKTVTAPTKVRPAGQCSGSPAISSAYL